MRDVIMTFDIVTVGAATQDVFLKSKTFEEVRDPYAPDGVDACFPMGSKIGLEDVTFATGGGATNAAITFARWGYKTATVTRVGADAAGSAIKQELSDEGISTVGLQLDAKHKTAYSVIILSGSGHRAILTYRGASQHLRASDIPWKNLRPKWFYITSVGGNIELLSRLFLHAEKLKARIAWNPGNAELDLGMKKLEPFLVRTSILITNREEAARLAELPQRDLRTILSHLGIYPQQALIITDGQKGAYVRAERKTYFAPPLRAKRVNTTGAGDAFGSGFVAAWIKKPDVKRSLKIAMLNATGVVTHMGAKAGILPKMPGLIGMARVRVKMVRS